MTNVTPAAGDVLSFSRRELRLLDLQQALEQTGEERGDIAYTSPLWARFSLPHRNPGEGVIRWEAKNGDTTLTVRPGEKLNAEGQWESAGYPFGVIPRMALTFMATTAVQTQEPVIQLGDSQRDFMNRIGVAHGKTDRRRIRTQLESLAACDIQLSQHASTDAGWGYRTSRLPITKGLQLWLNGREEGPALWGSTVVLSDEFFESIINSAMPVYLDDLRALGGSSMRHDIYVWLTYRLYTLTSTARISWDQLHAQFGSSYKQRRQFKAKFIEALNDVLKVYTRANVRVTDTTLELRPSAPHVRQIKS